MIVGDPDLVCMVVFPDEDDPPLLVDADAVICAQVSGEFFKTVAGWDAKMVQFRGCMKLIQFDLGACLDFSRQLATGFEIKNLSGSCIGETFDHIVTITENGNSRKSEPVAACMPGSYS
jgi:hypothetical protein